MSTRDAVAQYVRAPKTVALVAAAALSVVAAYATLTLVVASELAFLVVIVLGVSVPTTLDNYGLLPAASPRLVGTVVAACLAHWTVFLALFVAARTAASELVAAAAAFVVTVVASAAVGLSLQE